MTTDIAQTYRKLTPREHVLLRPSVYIGPIVSEDASNVWMLDANGARMELRETVRVNPGLCKVFDEALSNAADHALRKLEIPVKVIQVSIDAEAGTISVRNDGSGIDVAMHPEHGIYVPELIFSHLLSSTNYDDTQERLGVGQNGVGIKSLNIFSKWFEVECIDPTRGLSYKQRFEDNMSRTLPPAIKKSALKTPSTTVTFKLDLERFGMERLDEDTVQLFRKRVYDCAVALPSVAVSFNGTKIAARTLKQYASLYIGDAPSVYARLSEDFEILVSHSQDGFRQVSFVNGALTPRGGRHIDIVSYQLVAQMTEVARKKLKVDNLRPGVIRDQLFVFVRATVVNPSYDSQSKEVLTTPFNKLSSSKLDVPASVSEKLLSNPLFLERIQRINAANEDKALKKTDGQARRVTVRGIAKLEDATLAGTARSNECTLIICEGDSAASMAISGLAVVGRETFGVFPIRGKLLNVREASAIKSVENAELKALKTILGLQTGADYVASARGGGGVAGLRYGKLMVATDADVDGSHIRGLLFNLFDCMWGSLLKANVFMSALLTPLVKAKRVSDGQMCEFYSMNSFEAADPSLYTQVKYYKGLGTSTSAEAREYFSDMKRVSFTYNGAKDADALSLAFDKKRADDRKVWLGGYDSANVVEYTADSTVPYESFVNQDLIHFSNYDNLRSIPNALDGLKVSQRKCVHVAAGLSSEIKIAQLSSRVAERTEYHHGEVSLNSTIVNLCQDFVGSNNCNLLLPIGQLGTRLMGGSDAAACRYTFTKPAPVFSRVFRPEDVPILKQQVEDGTAIEPVHMLPVVPMLLINGAAGIGTGYSTSIPPHKPSDAVACLRAFLAGQPMPELGPWFRGFKGEVCEFAPGRFCTRGVYVREGPAIVRVKELPIGFWTSDFKALLEERIECAASAVRDYNNHSSDVSVDVLITFESEAKLDALLALDADCMTAARCGLERELKLASTKQCAYSNMYALGDKGQVRKFASAHEIVANFAEARLAGYVERKRLALEAALKELARIEAKYSFVCAVVAGTIKPTEYNKGGLEERLAEEPEVYGAETDHILAMPVYSLTTDKAEDLQRALERKRVALERMAATTPRETWDIELAEFLSGVEADEASAAKVQAGSAAKPADKAPAKRRAPEQSAVNTKKQQI